MMGGDLVRTLLVPNGTIGSHLMDVFNSTRSSNGDDDGGGGGGGDPAVDLRDTVYGESSNFGQLFHQPIDIQIRVLVLWIIAVTGIVGNVSVLLWMYANRGRRSRINQLILHLTVADLLVVGLAICPQLVWEYSRRTWLLGDFLCRLFKFVQTASISVSNYMVVVMAVDRYCAIRRPLKKPFPVSYMTGSAWGLAVVLNMANFFLYESREIDDATYCRNVLYDQPEVYLRTYITAVTVFVLVLPFLVICFTYTRIFQKISQKTSESLRSKSSSIKPGKVHLQATRSSTLPKARAKTFRMTIVIVVSFVACGTPYFVCDMYRVYGGQNLPSTSWAILGALAVSNSSTNPFVLLGFNTKGRWWYKLFGLSGCRGASSSSASSLPLRNGRGQSTSGYGHRHTQPEHLVLESLVSSGSSLAAPSAVSKSAQKQSS